MARISKRKPSSLCNTGIPNVIFWISSRSTTRSGVCLRATGPSGNGNPSRYDRDQRAVSDPVLAPSLKVGGRVARVPGELMFNGMPVQMAYDWNELNTSLPMHLVCAAGSLEIRPSGNTNLGYRRRLPSFIWAGRSAAGLCLGAHPRAHQHRGKLPGFRAGLQERTTLPRHTTQSGHGR